MKKIINKTLALLVAAATLSSCLKDDSVVLNPEKGFNVIEFANVSDIAVHGSSIPLYVLSYEQSSTPTVVPVTISYSGPEAAAPADITVNFSLSPAAITAYNSEQGKSYEAMPSNYYSLASSSVVIPKGKKTATFNVSFSTANFDLSKAFALALKITSASSGIVSSNFGTIVLAVGVKNPYDGVYTYTTSANTSLVPNAKKTVTLITADATTVNLSPGLLGTYSNAVSYSVDPTTKAVTVTCPSLGVQTPQDTRSNWNSTTKTLTVFWKQGNGGRTFEEVFVYKGAR